MPPHVHLMPPHVLMHATLSVLGSWGEPNVSKVPSDQCSQERGVLSTYPNAAYPSLPQTERGPILHTVTYSYIVTCDLSVEEETLC